MFLNLLPLNLRFWESDIGSNIFKCIGALHVNKDNPFLHQFLCFVMQKCSTVTGVWMGSNMLIRWVQTNWNQSKVSSSFIVSLSLLCHWLSWVWWQFVGLRSSGTCSWCTAMPSSKRVKKHVNTFAFDWNVSMWLYCQNKGYAHPGHAADAQPCLGAWNSNTNICLVMWICAKYKLLEI